MPETRKCKECGAEFEAKSRIHIYCTTQCQEDGRSGRKRSTKLACRKLRFCRWCGVLFSPRRRNALNCSSYCTHRVWEAINREHRQRYLNDPERRKRSRQHVRKSYRRKREKYLAATRAWRVLNSDREKRTRLEYLRKLAREQLEIDLLRVRTELARTLENGSTHPGQRENGSPVP